MFKNKFQDAIFQQPVNHFNSFTKTTVCQRKFSFDDCGENESRNTWGFSLL